MKKICIVTSGHPIHDERIFWKFALSLKEYGFPVSIISSVENISSTEMGILLKGFNGENLSKREKINKLGELIASSSPDMIICCEPLTILAAHSYKKKNNRNCRVISDITEWYPENVALKYKGVKKIAGYISLYLFNIYTVNKADELIIGEVRKKGRYDLIAPFKKKTIITYYPVLRLFEFSPRKINDELVLCYAGLISFERGIITLLKAASDIAAKYRGLKVTVKLLGKFQNPSEEEEFLGSVETYKRINIRYDGWTSYDKISEHLKDVHICFDLRIRNFIYNNSLPIKIFEYMAAGKPFIYSNIRPLRDDPDYGYCGQLVDPFNLNEITEAVERYIKDRELISVHSRNGRSIVEKEKNWEKESSKLIELINRT